MVANWRRAGGPCVKLSYSCCFCAISGMTKCNERAHCVTLAQALCFLHRAVPQRVPSMVERSQGAFFFWCSSVILCGSSRSKSSGASESARLCRCIWCDLPRVQSCHVALLLLPVVTCDDARCERLIALDVGCSDLRLGSSTVPYVFNFRPCLHLRGNVEGIF